MRLFHQISLFFALIAITTLVNAAPECRFAFKYSDHQLLNDKLAQADYLRHVMYWEGKFHQIAYNNKTGITHDGTQIEYSTGLPTNPLHDWTAASKESIHMMLLAMALDGNEYAKIFISANYDGTPSHNVDDIALSIMEMKMTFLEKWNQNYPGFGGYIPWVTSSNDGGITPLPQWKDSVPALDNGEMVWAMYAFKTVAHRRPDLRSKRLATRVSKYLNLLAETARTIFFDKSGNIRAVATIQNPNAPPSNPDHYGMNCDGKPESNCFLDDPYEGELMVVFMDLFSKWSNESERESVWINKRRKLQAVDYVTAAGNITVQRGFWFSSHEQWKYLELPYLEASTTNRRVYFNGERVRTKNSEILNIPGLYASVTEVAPPGQLPPKYISDCGIPSVSFQPVHSLNTITPYGAFPIMLMDLGMGLVWYNHMLKGNAMQGPLGSSEATNLQGTMISPVVTWDSKITSVVAMLGGIGKIVKHGLEFEGHYQRFASIIEREWSRVFPVLRGEHVSLGRPSASIPITPQLNDFSTCRRQ